MLISIGRVNFVNISNLTVDNITIFNDDYHQVATVINFLAGSKTSVINLMNLTFNLIRLEDYLSFNYDIFQS